MRSSSTTSGWDIGERSAERVIYRAAIVAWLLLPVVTAIAVAVD